ncbi:hypothetical protein HCU01_10190 [Halomonas cupida]|uniref:MerR HTH family regulatory protein n=1 Tax=Halomonas cupida TaxID=44933 RepID=A0A1M7DLF1_9GAMM|nr:hypothetical protein HCU01_10190 [Halomonas cupida]SHL80351.1 MerR HTH family regulatory protein [Halomonas cupida]
MNEAPENLTIGTIAQAAGVNVETIRFYQHRGGQRRSAHLAASGDMAAPTWRE